MFRPVRDPVFVIGTGRSGTTILGEALSHHPLITYLNEPRDLWIRCYPQTDIWSRQAVERDGKVALTEDDALKGDARRLRWLFRHATMRTGGPVLVEKLPINSFRLPFIRAIFPDARFILIQRSGLEVAHSIAKLAKQGKWFGHADYKWHQLTELARARPETANLPDLCTSDVERGLLEWRLAHDTIQSFLTTIPDTSWVGVTYDRLVDAPVETLNYLLSFIGLAPDADVNDFAGSSISRRSQTLQGSIANESERQIGGTALLR